MVILIYNDDHNGNHCDRITIFCIEFVILLFIFWFIEVYLWA